MTSYDQRPNTRFSTVGAHLIEEIKMREYSVLVGRNNSGKSFVLKHITSQIGQHAAYIGPQRYNNFNVLNPYSQTKNRRSERWNQFIRQLQNQNQNIDNSPLNLQQAIAELNDYQREKLFEILNALLGVTVSIEYTVPNNKMSQMYVRCDGHNISYTSSGLRLIATLITVLLDEEYQTLLIDEPELGISPEAQGILADFLFDREKRKKYFQHIKCLIFATHSTIFLDRQKIGNNYTVTKSADEIDIKRVSTISDLNRVHFFLLGNRFETLYLPSAILMVEGPSDRLFIERILALKLPNSQFSIIQANNDSRMKELLHTAGTIFSDLQKSPYRERIFAILDKRHEKGLKSELTKKGIPEENVIIWCKNGIENYYPPTILDKIYGEGGELLIANDSVSRNDISYTKMELSEMVVSSLTSDTKLHDEFRQKLLMPLQAIIDQP